MKKFIIFSAIFSCISAGDWVPENSTNCWGQICQPSSACWRPAQWDLPALCLPKPLDPNVDWDFKIYDGNLILIDVKKLNYHFFFQNLF